MTLKLSDLPSIEFIDKDIDSILNRMIRDYENAHFEATNERMRLRPGDPRRIFLYSQALRELQLRIKMDDSAKQNLLAFARDGNLDHLGSFSRTPRFEADFANVKMKFVLSGARPTDEIIEAGTRVSPGDDIYFANEEDITVPAGDTEIEFKTIALEPGTDANGFTPGQINILVDPIPWIGSVENIEESSGGLDEEEDSAYRERIHLAPEGFSVAGPEGAYEHFARQYSAQVSDVKITSPNPVEVDIRVLLQNGVIPDAEFLTGMNEYLSAKERRPLTDLVSVSGPDTITYNLDVTYYVKSSDADLETDLKQKIEDAIDDYIVWQRSKIGRDINPDELTGKAREAGAKRIVVVSPTFSQISENQIAVVDLKTVNYGGLEDE